jgi:branched-chain amino acid transport system permease protein
MMVVGGMGSIPGSILGGIVLTIIPEVLRFVGNIRLVLYGIAIVAIIVFAPKGMGGLIEWIDRKLMSVGTKKVKEQKEEQK